MAALSILVLFAFASTIFLVSDDAQNVQDEDDIDLNDQVDENDQDQVIDSPPDTDKQNVEHQNDPLDNPTQYVENDLYISGDSDGYNIQLNFEGNWTSEMRDAAIDAAEFISDIILSDIPDSEVDRFGVVDDIVVDIEVKNLRGSYLGYAYVNDVRDTDLLPSHSTIKLDDSVFDRYGIDAFRDTILHELLHAVGFGAIWYDKGLISSNGPRFTGSNAHAYYLENLASLNPTDLNPELGVPLEVEGGSSTAYSHWSEDVFNQELMTGYLDNDESHISELTIASLEDLGYDTVFDNPNDPYDRHGDTPIWNTYISV